MSKYQIGKDVQELKQRIERLEGTCKCTESPKFGGDGEGSTAIVATAKQQDFESAAYVIYNAADGAIGHTPAGRGRVEGSSWYDYGNTTSGKIMYGPYVQLGPGAYEYWFDVRYRIPPCGSADNRVLFELDATRNVGQLIPESRRVSRWKLFCDSPYTHEGVFDSWIGGTFSIAETTSQVEMRLGNVVVGSTAIPMEILVRRLLYRKIS